MRNTKYFSLLIAILFLTSCANSQSNNTNSKIKKEEKIMLQDKLQNLKKQIYSNMPKADTDNLDKQIQELRDCLVLKKVYS